MGDLTVDDFETQMRIALGNRTDLDDSLKTYLRFAQLRILRQNDLEELHGVNTITTVIDDFTYTLGSGFTGAPIREIKSIKTITSDGRSRKLIKLSLSEFEDRFPDIAYDSAGYPIYYAVTLETTLFSIEIYPKPDDAYALKYRFNYWPVSPGDGTNDLSGADKLIPRNIDDLVLNLAISIAYQHLGREDKAKEYFSIYAAMASDLYLLKHEDYDTTLAGLVVGGARRGGDYWNDPFVKESP